MIPTHAIVDSRDGCTFWRDSGGEFFTAERARRFRDQRNAELVDPTYVVVTLKEEVTPR